ncbi:MULTISPECIES: trypsin-like serine peptidase [Amycolatopsis]|uniref:Trypsin-like peptidase domain-containing protein n=1 Tax=Amycolatopsis dendrobii TaxID=2760662 RepID=A0A7W3ZDF1_9PSEU|nr:MULTISPECIES: trypsin-like peptidase domain-containing protein [Amycolatopsis]MBB1156809.1 trypsin-like peptidase domain-containing protein [Amycolatopsis dendrobii]UKD53517.1 trypsin-like peptidase domain-containing protein [Amycolatopsis sp. FU40]
MRRTVIGLFALMSASGTIVACAEHAAEPAVATTPTPAKPIQASIGALFVDGSHYCTASVVHSPRGDELLTAAHCIHDGEGGGYLANVTFAPGFHDGVAPYGYWQVGNELVAQSWIDSSDPNLDVGFATARQDGSPEPLETVTGANQLGTNGPFARPVTVAGYPDGVDELATCETHTQQQDEHQMRVDCPGFATGTSGSPLVADPSPDTKTGTVVGVIGGYEGGGYTDDVSYSSYFDDQIIDLYNRATTMP